MESFLVAILCNLILHAIKSENTMYIFRVKTVAYLECDIGQTEFTCPGCVALNLVSEPLLGKKLKLIMFKAIYLEYGTTCM